MLWMLEPVPYVMTVLCAKHIGVQVVTMHACEVLDVILHDPVLEVHLVVQIHEETHPVELHALEVHVINLEVLDLEVPLLIFSSLSTA